MALCVLRLRAIRSILPHFYSFQRSLSCVSIDWTTLSKMTLPHTSKWTAVRLLHNTSQDINIVNDELKKNAHFMQQKMESELTRLGIQFKIVQVSDADAYFAMSLDERAKLLQANGPESLCKTMVMENRAHKADMQSPQFVFVIVQYITKLKGDKLTDVVKLPGQGKKRFRWRVSESGEQLSGYSHNAVTPFLSKTPMPIVLSSRAAALPQIWLGGGHAALKIGIDTADFIDKLNVTVGDIMDEKDSPDISNGDHNGMMSI